MSLLVIIEYGVDSMSNCNDSTVTKLRLNKTGYLGICIQVHGRGGLIKNK